MSVFDVDEILCDEEGPWETVTKNKKAKEKKPAQPDVHATGRNNSGSAQAKKARGIAPPSARKGNKNQGGKTPAPEDDWRAAKRKAALEAEQRTLLKRVQIERRQSNHGVGRAGSTVRNQPGARACKGGGATKGEAACKNKSKHEGGFHVATSYDVAFPDLPGAGGKQKGLPIDDGHFIEGYIGGPFCGVYEGYEVPPDMPDGMGFMDPLEDFKWMDETDRQFERIPGQFYPDHEAPYTMEFETGNLYGADDLNFSNRDGSFAEFGDNQKPTNAQHQRNQVSVMSNASLIDDAASSDNDRTAGKKRRRRVRTRKNRLTETTTTDEEDDPTVEPTCDYPLDVKTTDFQENGTRRAPVLPSLDERGSALVTDGSQQAQGHRELGDIHHINEAVVAETCLENKKGQSGIGDNDERIGSDRTKQFSRNGVEDDHPENVAPESCGEIYTGLSKNKLNTREAAFPEKRDARIQPSSGVPNSENENNNCQKTIDTGMPNDTTKTSAGSKEAGDGSSNDVGPVDTDSTSVMQSQRKSIEADCVSDTAGNGVQHPEKDDVSNAAEPEKGNQGNDIIQTTAADTSVIKPPSIVNQDVDGHASQEGCTLILGQEDEKIVKEHRAALNETGGESVCNEPDVATQCDNNGDAKICDDTKKETKKKRKRKKKNAKVEKTKPVTIGDVVNYVMAKLKAVYAGNDMTASGQVTEIEDSPLPVQLAGHVKQLKSLAVNYAPYVHAREGRRDSEGESSYDECLDSECSVEERGDVGGVYSEGKPSESDMSEEELIRRYRIKLQSYGKLNHLLEVLTSQHTGLASVGWPAQALSTLDHAYPDSCSSSLSASTATLTGDAVIESDIESEKSASQAITGCEKDIVVVVENRDGMKYEGADECSRNLLRQAAEPIATAPEDDVKCETTGYPHTSVLLDKDKPSFSSDREIADNTNDPHSNCEETEESGLNKIVKLNAVYNAKASAIESHEGISKLTYEEDGRYHDDAVCSVMKLLEEYHEYVICETHRRVQMHSDRHALREYLRSRLADIQRDLESDVLGTKRGEWKREGEAHVSSSSRGGEILHSVTSVGRGAARPPAAAMVDADLLGRGWLDRGLLDCIENPTGDSSITQGKNKVDRSRKFKGLSYWWLAGGLEL